MNMQIHLYFIIIERKIKMKKTIEQLEKEIQKCRDKENNLIQQLEQLKKEKQLEQVKEHVKDGWFECDDEYHIDLGDDISFVYDCDNNISIWESDMENCINFDITSWKNIKNLFKIILDSEKEQNND
jgi:chromosome segregation ATPase